MGEKNNNVINHSRARQGCQRRRRRRCHSGEKKKSEKKNKNKNKSQNVNNSSRHRRSRDSIIQGCRTCRKRDPDFVSRCTEK